MSGGITTIPPRSPSGACWLAARLLTDPAHPVGGTGPVDPWARFPSLFQEAFEKLVHHMCSGPSHLLILTRTEDTEDVATTWRALMGPCDPHMARREQPDR